MKKKIGIVFMILGIALVIASACLLIHNKLDDKRAGESADKILSQMQEDENEDSLPIPHSMPVKEIDGHDYIGYISIPKIERDLPVRADWKFDELRAVPQRYCGTIYDNDMVLASHSYSYHFGFIYKLTVGDDVFFKDVTGKVYAYKVTNVQMLRAADMDKLLDKSADLTLFTCDYTARRRVVVRCDRVER